MLASVILKFEPNVQLSGRPFNRNVKRLDSILHLIILRLDSDASNPISVIPYFSLYLSYAPRCSDQKWFCPKDLRCLRIGIRVAQKMATRLGKCEVLF
jgi:hypothetical protein